MRATYGIWVVVMVLLLAAPYSVSAGEMDGHAAVVDAEEAEMESGEETAWEDVLLDLQDTVLDHILTVTDDQGFYALEGKELSFLDFHQDFQEDNGRYVIGAAFVDLTAKEEVTAEFTLKANDGLYTLEGARISDVAPLSDDTRALMMEYEQDDMDAGGDEY